MKYGVFVFQTQDRLFKSSVAMRLLSGCWSRAVEILPCCLLSPHIVCLDGEEGFTWSNCRDWQYPMANEFPSFFIHCQPQTGQRRQNHLEGNIAALVTFSSEWSSSFHGLHRTHAEIYLVIEREKKNHPTQCKELLWFIFNLLKIVSCASLSTGTVRHDH